MFSNSQIIKLPYEVECFTCHKVISKNTSAKVFPKEKLVLHMDCNPVVDYDLICFHCSRSFNPEDEIRIFYANSRKRKTKTGLEKPKYKLHLECYRERAHKYQEKFDRKMTRREAEGKSIWRHIENE